MADENFEEFGRDRWPEFGTSTVTGMKLLNLVDWVRTSNCMLKTNQDPKGMPVIAMPPVQRSAVWRPKQVLDLWDSLMRGLPIGTFYLLDYRNGRPASAQNVTPCDGSETKLSTLPGFDLLDGQQRVRALWVGAHRFAEDKRCLWVDLGAKTAAEFPCFYLTSEAQPFGYDPTTGRKRHVDERRKARESIEPIPPNPMNPREKITVEQMVRDRKAIMIQKAGDLRIAYDHELFEDKIAPEGVQITQPPLPYGATEGKTFKLHELLASWRKRSTSDPPATTVPSSLPAP